jgi:hypothetical protein
MLMKQSSTLIVDSSMEGKSTDSDGRKEQNEEEGEEDSTSTFKPSSLLRTSWNS